MRCVGAKAERTACTIWNAQRRQQGRQSRPSPGIWLLERNRTGCAAPAAGDFSTPIHRFTDVPSPEL